MASVSTTANGETEYNTPLRASAKAAGHSECSRIEIEPAKNGAFIATCYYKSTSNKGGGSYMEPERSAFNSFDELTAYLAKELGAAQAEPADGGSDDSDQDGM